MKPLLFAVCLFIFNTIEVDAQTKPGHTIAAYELIDRTNTSNQTITKPRYEIQGLFVKNDTGWALADYPKQVHFRLTYKGLAGQKISGSLVTDTNNYRPDGSGYYRPIPQLALTDKYFFKPFERADAGIKKLVFLSDNPSLKQIHSLKKYTPTIEEQRTIHGEAIPYLWTAFRGLHCREDVLSDSVLGLMLETNNILIDYALVDESKNKLISFIYPVPIEYRGYYPFNGECFREDTYAGFRILCYLDKNGKLSFLHDELNYIDHADFDGDGKDEFLFWYGIHNNEGFVLFYDDFKRSASRLWNYH